MLDRRFLKRVSRYLSVQRKRSEAALYKLDAGSWFDYWHTHIDWRCRAHRTPDLVARHTIELLMLAEHVVGHRAGEVQAWATICPCTSDNAVYLHSANPNGSEYPYDFVDVSWGQPAPFPEVSGISSHEFGILHSEEGSVYFCRARA